MNTDYFKILKVRNKNIICVYLRRSVSYLKWRLKKVQVPIPQAGPFFQNHIFGNRFHEMDEQAVSGPFQGGLFGL
jgi:hypothetical protein